MASYALISIKAQSMLQGEKPGFLFMSGNGIYSGYKLFIWRTIPKRCLLGTYRLNQHQNSLNPVDGIYVKNLQQNIYFEGNFCTLILSYKK